MLTPLFPAFLALNRVVLTLKRGVLTPGLPHPGSVLTPTWKIVFSALAPRFLHFWHPTALGLHCKGVCSPLAYLLLTPSRQCAYPGMASSIFSACPLLPALLALNRVVTAGIEQSEFLMDFGICETRHHTGTCASREKMGER